MYAALALLVAALPPIRTVVDARTQLGVEGSADQLAALANLAAACRTSARFALKDEPTVVARLKTLAGKSKELKRGVLDAGRCFSPGVFLTMLEPQLADPDPAVASYAAEAAARYGDPAVAAPMLARLAERKPACTAPGLPPPEVERCVWLTYGPGAVLEKASREQRTEAASAAAAMLASPYPKVREVAVETLASARLKVHGAAIEALVKKERSGGFDPANPAALLERFLERAKALKNKGE